MIKPARAIFLGFVVFCLCFAIVSQRAEAKSNPISAEEKRAMIKSAKEELNGSVWEIELKPMASSSNKKLEKTTDTLRFEDKKIRSDKLIKEGFIASNYTVRIKGKDNDIVIWETMQTSDENGVAFWRGEVRKGSNMRGVLSWHVTDKRKKDYTFTSVEKAIAVEAEMIVEEVDEIPVAAVEIIGVEEAKDKVKAEVEEKAKEESEVAVKEEKSKKKEKKKRGMF